VHTTTKHVYDYPIKTVYALLTDAEFLKSLFDDADTISHEVQVVGSRTSATAVLSTPQQMRRFTGSTISATLLIDWGELHSDGSYHGVISSDLKGLPAQLSGTASLHPTASGTTVVYDTDFVISVPFVGRKLETAAAPYVMQIIDAQQPLGKAWLATHNL
jgi:hypothetical protein